MESKKLLVQSPHLPVIEIALMVGFESPAHFSHTFRKMTNETPSVFRKKNLGKHSRK
jgi:AraC-like DNA-binding protein